MSRLTSPEAELNSGICVCLEYVTDKLQTFPFSHIFILSRGQALLLILLHQFGRQGIQFHCLAVARGFQNFPLEGTWGSHP